MVSRPAPSLQLQPTKLGLESIEIMSKHADTAWHGCHLGDNDPDKEVIEDGSALANRASSRGALEPNDSGAACTQLYLPALSPSHVIWYSNHARSRASFAKAGDASLSRMRTTHPAHNSISACSFSPICFWTNATRP